MPDKQQDFYAPNDKPEALAEVEKAAQANAKKTLQENLESLQEQENA